MFLTPQRYLQDGPTSPWHVPDLLPTDPTPIRLLFVLESPHVDELEPPRRPLVGEAGKSALKYLQGTSWNGDSLGNFVANKHAAGDGRLAVLNISTVPLQEAAFTRTSIPPALTRQEWRWLGETFRNSTASTVNATGVSKADAAGQLLLDGLQDRVDRLVLSSACTVVACGRWVQRFVRQLTALPSVPLKVPHPANHQWHPKKKSLPKELVSLRKLFLDYS